MIFYEFSVHFKTRRREIITDFDLLSMKVAYLDVTRQKANLSNMDALNANYFKVPL